MQLTKEQENMLSGGDGVVRERMMRLLVRLGEIYGASEMIPVSSVQVAGVSYKSIKDPGLDFLADLADNGAKVVVPTFLNPAGIDIEAWRELGFPEKFAIKQIKILDSFKAMGIVPSASCTPYLAGLLPRFGEHIAWSESSAVSFSNSVIGARTNREGGPSALAAAICGVTPNYGLHLDENRFATHLIEVNAGLHSTSDYAALGFKIGSIVKDGKPFFSGIKGGTTDHFKALGAAMAASGAVALYHVEGITPEAGLQDISGLEKITVTKKDLKDAYCEATTADSVDAIIVGCPHASLREISHIAGIVKGNKLNKPLWVCTSRAVLGTARQMGVAGVIEDAGGKLIADTCMVVAPLEDFPFKNVGVDSGKAAKYMPGFCKKGVVMRSIDELLREALE